MTTEQCLCPCGHRFDAHLGAYGCPNCEGDAGPADQDPDAIRPTSRVPGPAAAPDQPGTPARLEALRLEPGQGAGRRQVGPVPWDRTGPDGRHVSHWPGRFAGVRQPAPDETPLSWAEVPYILNTYTARA